MDGVGELEYPERDELQLVDVLQALGDPVRLQIVRFLDDSDGAIACHEIPIPVSKSTGSHHLKVLREAGVVKAQVDGTRRYYTLRTDDLEARFPGLLDSVLQLHTGHALIGREIARRPARSTCADAHDSLPSDDGTTADRGSTRLGSAPRVAANEAIAPARRGSAHRWIRPARAAVRAPPLGVWHPGAHSPGRSRGGPDVVDRQMRTGVGSARADVGHDLACSCTNP